MFVKPEVLFVYIKLSNVLHHSMQPQNYDFNSYIYILYYQSNIYFIQHLIRLVFWILVIKLNLTEVSEQPRGKTPTLNVMVIRDQRHANVSKQRTLLEDVDVAPPQGTA